MQHRGIVTAVVIVVLGASPSTRVVGHDVMQFTLRRTQPSTLHIFSSIKGRTKMSKFEIIFAHFVNTFQRKSDMTTPIAA